MKNFVVLVEDPIIHTNIEQLVGTKVQLSQGSIYSIVQVVERTCGCSVAGIIQVTLLKRMFTVLRVDCLQTYVSPSLYTL